MIKPPSWAKNAIPTSVGWKDPRSGELLKAGRISQTDIDAYMGVSAPAPAPTPPPPPPPPPSHDTTGHGPAMDEDDDRLLEDDDYESDLEGMTKVELEQLGRKYGVELDRRLNKATLVEQMREIIKS